MQQLSTAIAPHALFTVLSEQWPEIEDHLTASVSRACKAKLAKEFRDFEKHVEVCVGVAALAQNESVANGWRSAQVLVSSVVSELLMWLRIGREDGDLAWNNFCDAEREALHCSRWPLSRGLGLSRLDHLAVVERTVFPKQRYFFSSAYIAAKRTCTICESDYGKCEHLSGELYNGQIAARRVGDIVRVVEISLVEQPRNKICRITSISGIDPLTGEACRYARGPESAHPRDQNETSSAPESD